MEQIIKALETATNIAMLPFGTDTVEKSCIVYKNSTISDNGAVRQDKLELRLITHTLAEAEEIKPLILSTLITIGDNSKLGYLSCELNGGGQLEDYNTDTIHTLLYFIITKKSEVKL